MNILILTHSFPDSTHEWRGVFVREQARAAGRIHNVTVVYFRADYNHFAPFAKYSFEKKTEDNITLFEVTVKKSFPVITQLKLLSNTFRFIKKEIFSEEKPDIIHSHLSYPGGFLGTIIQKLTGIPNVLTEHSTLKLYNRSLIHSLFVRWTLKNATGLISVSSSLKDEIGLIRKKEIRVIPNIVDTELFKPAAPQAGDKLNIGFLGGLNNTNKGLDLLLEACSKNLNRSFKLHIGGAGKLLEHYKSMAAELGIKETCIFYGEITRGEIAGFYSKLDLFVLPSRYETFGIVLIEAMASGVPVISTRCGGPQDIIKDQTGILVEKDNPQELGAAINKMADNIKSYDKETIRNYAKENYSGSRVTEMITGLYHEIKKQHGD